eukprot:TRINITY_DN5343_c0_g1_i1.p1 TRINITY_DN5343_c0_g1~~TRINITY_DN5343_c0_g1_i1.p1  ORF type:complete len:165 (-),score=19.85 TRINITY_DN5343_c0_g1_i1:42-536(-)
MRTKTTTSNTTKTNKEKLLIRRIEKRFTRISWLHITTSGIIILKTEILHLLGFQFQFHFKITRRMQTSSPIFQPEIPDGDYRSYLRPSYASKKHFLAHAKRTGKSRDYVLRKSEIGCRDCCHGRGSCYRTNAKGSIKTKRCEFKNELEDNSIVSSKSNYFPRSF